MPGAESPLLTDSPKVNCDRPSEQASAPFTLSSPVSLAAASPATGPSGMQTSSPGLTPEPVLDARSRMLSEPKAIADLGASTALPTSNAFRLGASSFATKACGIHRQGAQAYASQSAGPSALHKCGTYPEACHAPSSAADAEDKQPQQLHHGTITISALVSLANRELEDDHITSGQMEGLQEVVGDMQTLLSVHMDKVNSVLCQDGKLVGMQVVVTRRLLRDLRQRSVNMSTDAC